MKQKKINKKKWNKFSKYRNITFFSEGLFNENKQVVKFLNTLNIFVSNYKKGLGKACCLYAPGLSTELVFKILMMKIVHHINNDIVYIFIAKIMFLKIGNDQLKKYNHCIYTTQFPCKNVNSFMLI